MTVADLRILLVIAEDIDGDEKKARELRQQISDLQHDEAHTVISDRG